MTKDELLQLKRGDIVLISLKTMRVEAELIFKKIASDGKCNCVDYRGVKVFPEIYQIQELLMTKEEICGKCIVASTCDIFKHILNCYYERTDNDKRRVQGYKGV